MYETYIGRDTEPNLRRLGCFGRYEGNDREVFLSSLGKNPIYLFPLFFFFFLNIFFFLDIYRYIHLINMRKEISIRPSSTCFYSPNPKLFTRLKKKGLSFFSSNLDRSSVSLL